MLKRYPIFAQTYPTLAKNTQILQKITQLLPKSTQLLLKSTQFLTKNTHFSPKNNQIFSKGNQFEPNAPSFITYSEKFPINERHQLKSFLNCSNLLPVFPEFRNFRTLHVSKLLLDERFMED